MADNTSHIHVLEEMLNDVRRDRDVWIMAADDAQKYGWHHRYETLQGIIQELEEQANALDAALCALGGK